MKKAVWTALTAAGMIALAMPAAAQTTATKTIGVTVNVSARATLDLGGVTALTFADADPDTTPSITSSAVNVAVKGRTSGGSNVTLTVISNQDLTSGSDVITIDNLTWTGSGSGFAATGTMSKSSAVSVGSWTNSGNHSGSFTLAMANSWSYNVGSYTATLTYTLTAP